MTQRCGNGAERLHRFEWKEDRRQGRPARAFRSPIAAVAGEGISFFDLNGPDRATRQFRRLSGYLKNHSSRQFRTKLVFSRSADEHDGLAPLRRACRQ